jgi:hypothetical protein
MPCAIGKNQTYQDQQGEKNKAGGMQINGENKWP